MGNTQMPSSAVVPACFEPNWGDIGEPNKPTRIVKRKSASVETPTRGRELDVYRANPDTPQKDALRNEVEARDEQIKTLKVQLRGVQ